MLDEVDSAEIDLDSDNRVGLLRRGEDIALVSASSSVAYSNGMLKSSAEI